MSLERIDPERWNNALDEVGVADIYFRYEQVSVSAELDGGEPVLLQLRSGGDGVHDIGSGGGSGAVSFAFLLRRIPDGGGSFDIVTPYGYGGPVATGEMPPIDAFHAAFDAWGIDNGVVSTFIRYHPLLQNHEYAHPKAEVVQLAGTVAIDTSADRDLLMTMHGKHRNVVRKALAAGVEVRTVEGSEDLGEFADLYDLTMRRQNAADFYFFPDAYWRALESGLRPHVVRFDALLEGRLVASALCFATEPYLHYHLGATADEARNLGASNLLLHEASLWAQQRGWSAVHLGGGVGGSADSLLKFKQRFDGDGLRACAIGKLVNDAARYRELAGIDAAAPAAALTEGFFPAYRAPVLDPA